MRNASYTHPLPLGIRGARESINAMRPAEKGDSSAAWGCILMLLIMCYGLAQVYAGFIGIRHHWGGGWAVAAVALAFMFRFSLPLTIGSFFGAMNVWGWHWLGALVFAAPGLAFMALMIPGALAAALASIRR